MVHYLWLSSFFFLLFATFITGKTNAAQEERKIYIVYMGAIPDMDQYSLSAQHLSILREVIHGSSPEKFLIRSYTKSINGFAANLTEQEYQKLNGHEEVVSIFPSKTLRLLTTGSWDYTGFPLNVSRNLVVERDIIIGILDTGIWPESQSFTDLGLGPIPKKWKGTCDGGENFTCNGKVIGARKFTSPSARDVIGHGSHTASTAAGNNVPNVSFHGIPPGTARGGVPSARIAVYKVCESIGCSEHNIMAAFDNAIADGVDILSVSLGPRAPRPPGQDAIAIGALHAAQKGILTVQSAGNSGSVSGYIGSIAPWLFSIAASSTDRKITRKVNLKGQKSIEGRAVNPFKLSETEIAQNKIPPKVAPFSSRGPNRYFPNILKPDITAPGVNILAAYSPMGSPPLNYNILSGTSMSCPHVSGAAAYVKSFHPDWSPSALKSALMTTAWKMDNSQSKYGDAEFSYGAGHFDPVKALNPGLVYETTKEDYVNLICSMHLDDNSRILRKIFGDKTITCKPNDLTKEPKDLNYPSMAADVDLKTKNSFSVTFPRTVTNVGTPSSTYTAKSYCDQGCKVTVNPATLTFQAMNEKKSFNVTISGLNSSRKMISASIEWVDDVHQVRSPIVIY